MTYPAHVLRVARLIQALGDVLPWNTLAPLLDKARLGSEWDAPFQEDVSPRQLVYASAIAGSSTDDAVRLLTETANESAAEATRLLARARLLRERAAKLEFGARVVHRLAARAAEVDAEAGRLEGWLERPLEGVERSRHGEPR